MARSVDVIGFEAVGEVSANDCKSVFDPAIDTALETHDEVRFLFLLGTEFTGFTGGAMWEDTKAGVARWTKFEKIALVSDHSGYRDGDNPLGWIIPGGFKTFSVADLDKAEA